MSARALLGAARTYRRLPGWLAKIVAWPFKKFTGVCLGWGWRQGARVWGVDGWVCTQQVLWCELTVCTHTKHPLCCRLVALSAGAQDAGGLRGAWVGVGEGQEWWCVKRGGACARAA